MSKFKARLYEKMKEADMMPKLDLPVVIGRLQALDKYDIVVWPCGTLFTGINTYGEWVKWDDIDRIIKELSNEQIQ